ncbi:MAG: ferrochelatase [Gammaproteobacteria bacterium]|nr:ferrochelatase [Gammaproteobacteria bacterium]
MKKGILLIQLGTPTAPTPRGVRYYLHLFLSDKRVIDLPAPLRYFLLYFIILPIRSKRSAKAYQAIWTKKGSPLRVLSESLAKKLQQKLKNTHHVTLGMRYGEPSLRQALNRLSHCDEITVLPLYPQYASSTNGSSIEVVLNYFKNKTVMPTLHIIRDFYTHPAFIKAQSAQIMPYLKKPFDHVLLSYHGLPVRHIEKTGCQKICDNACPDPQLSNTACYRAQCFETSRRLAEILALTKAQYTTVFQSRLGKTPWIEPYMDNTLEKLAKSGVKNLIVACPAFVTDCLETLEEIGIRAEETWKEMGGESLTLVPCLNDETHWVNALTEIIS